MFVLKVSGGREGRPIGAYELAKAVEELGAGEILLNCIDCDGKEYFGVPHPLQVNFSFEHSSFLGKEYIKLMIFTMNAKLFPL